MGSDELTPALQNGRNQINEWNDTIINQNQVYSFYLKLFVCFFLIKSFFQQLHGPVVSSLMAKSPLREQQQTVGSNISINGSQKGLISGEQRDRPRDVQYV